MLTQHEFNREVLEILEHMRREINDERIKYNIASLYDRLPVDEGEKGMN